VGCYKIEWKASAKKELKRLPKPTVGKILAAIDSLPLNLHPQGSKKIIGSEHTYRLRAGDYRILYSVYDNYLVIEIIRIGHRKDVYKKIT